jgi:hypothetical protein
LGWASFLNDVASEMIAPLLSAFLVLGANKFHLGVIEGMADSLSTTRSMSCRRDAALTFRDVCQQPNGLLLNPT